MKQYRKMESIGQMELDGQPITSNNKIYVSEKTKEIKNMKQYKNTTERILGTIQEEIRNQNEDVRNYGHTSNQAAISRSILNATLYALEISNVVYRGFIFHYNGRMITGLDLSVDGHRCFVSDVDYEIYD